MRELKRDHGYSLGEQEDMLPFERDLLLQTIFHEKLKQAEIPSQGWTQYAKEIGAAQKTKYQSKFQVVDEGPSAGAVRP